MIALACLGVVFLFFALLCGLSKLPICGPDGALDRFLAGTRKNQGDQS